MFFNMSIFRNAFTILRMHLQQRVYVLSVICQAIRTLVMYTYFLYCFIFIYFVTEWTLVFRGTRGNDVDIYDAWVNGTSVTTTDETCKILEDNSCTDHYRNPIVDSWNSLSMSKVN